MTPEFIIQIWCAKESVKCIKLVDTFIKLYKLEKKITRSLKSFISVDVTLAYLNLRIIA